MNTQRFATNKKGEAADINGELYHHGIKGQKWGVTRTPEELGHEQKKEALVRGTAAAIYERKAVKDPSYYPTASVMREKLLSGLSDEDVQNGKDYAESLWKSANRRFMPSKKAGRELENITDMANFSLEHPVGSKNRDTAVEYYNKARKQERRAARLDAKQARYLDEGNEAGAYRVKRKAEKQRRKAEKNRLKTASAK